MSSESSTPGKIPCSNGKRQINPDISQGDFVFIKGSDSKHTSLDPHIATKTDALHSNHNDVRPLAISSKFKTVDNKFLVKSYPPEQKCPNLKSNQPHSTSPYTMYPKLRPLSRTHTTPWHPIDLEDCSDLIPLSLSPKTNSTIYLETLGDQPPSDASPQPSMESLNTFDSPDYPDLDLTSPVRQSSNNGQPADDELSLSDQSVLSVMLLNDDLLIPERLDQHRRPIVGDRIL